MDQTRASELLFDQGTLVLSGWNAKAIERVFPAGWWSWDSRILAWRTYASRYTEVQELISQRSIGTTLLRPHWQKVLWSSISLPDLREEQSEAINAWQQSKRGVVVMPTGTGKTEVALRIMANEAVSTLVVAPIRDLMYQWHRRIQMSLNYDAGILGDGVNNVKAVTVTTYESACIHMPTLGDRFQLLVFDECHHLPGGMRQDSARMSIAPYRLGLTATPDRSDGNHRLYVDLIGETVYRLSVKDVAGKSLAPYEVIRIPVHLTPQEQARYDHLGKQLSEFVYQRRQNVPQYDWQTLCSEANQDPAARQALLWFRSRQAIEDRATEKLRILEDLFRLHVGSPVLVFAGSNAMAREVSLRFLIPCLLSHCGKRERQDYLDGLRDGTYPALIANQVLDEGVDIPAVKVAIVIGGKSSTRQAQQRLGRILRKQGEEIAVLYEVVCRDTNEELASRKRRRNDAYTRTRHRRL